MKRAALILLVGLLAAGCLWAADDEATTTTAPPWALDPGAPAANDAAGAAGWEGIVAEEAWRGWLWDVDAGGTIDLAYLAAEGCGGWASRAPVVEVSLPEDGQRWVFSYGVFALHGGWDQVMVPPGAVLVVLGPDGAFACSAEYEGWQGWQGWFDAQGPVVEIPSVKAGAYDVWVGAPEGTSISGQLVIAAPAAIFPTTTTTTTTTDPDEPPSEPATTVGG
jgi:hypothetical protein